MTIESVINVIEEVLNDETASDWLKWALRSALNRDILDATNDAELLFMILSTRLNAVLAYSEPVNEWDCSPL